MIKFVAAALWICAVTIGAVFYAFNTTQPDAEAKQPAALLGGLDYVKTDIISVPLLRNGAVQGYFLTRLVYTVEPEKRAKLSVPAQSLIVDEVYSYIYGSPELDFSKHETLDVDALRNGIKDSINARVGDTLVHEVLVEQIDYLSKEQIRNGSTRREPDVSEAGALQ